jgi:hypothetical protein
MEAAEGLKKFTDELASSTDKFSAMVSKLVNEFMAMGLSLQEASALAHMSARYSAQADSFAASGSRNRIPSLPPSYFENLGTRLEGNVNYAGMSAAEISMERLRESGNRPVNLVLTVDTANSGDRFNQLIAESIQAATKTGLSTSPIGAIP